MESDLVKKWNAEWIRIGWGDLCPLLRREFLVEKPVRKASVFATALGVCEVRVNGNKAGDCHLLPGWTDYRKRLYFHELDITDQLIPGRNALGAMLAPGWFAGFYGPFNDKGYYGHDAWFSAEVHIEYADGSRNVFYTGEDWRGAEGPMTKSDLLMGETYDARREIPGWDQPGFDDSQWSHALTLRADEEQLPESVEPFPGTPVRTLTELPAQSVTLLEPGRAVYDLGQNMVGVARLTLRVPAGTTLTLRHGEMLNEDGSVYTENLRSARAIDRYTARGGNSETWQPRFTFHGFRYVEIDGLPGDPEDVEVTGQVWMSDLRETASFECSNANVNRLFDNIRWSFRGNYLEVPTDCPQRDERLGWTGDTQIFMRSACYLADVRPFFEKWLVDLHDAQHADGGYPDMAPFLGRMGYSRAAWGDAGIICPYMLWQMYGELSFARRWWPRMKAYMARICEEGNPHNGPDAISYGDWLNIDAPTPVPLIGLAYRAYDARLMEEMASALGEQADATLFRKEKETSRTLFRNAFFRDGQIAVPTQTACALAIAMDLLDDADLQTACNCLVEQVERNNGYLNTGFVGTGYLAPALDKAGRCDLAVNLLLNEDYPSWLYEVNNGATTIWERWNSWTKEKGFGDVGMNSFNHYAFGVIFEWMIEGLAGIRPAEPGFSRLLIDPCFTDRLEFVRAACETVQGTVTVCWRRQPDGYSLEVDSPVPGEVRLPDGTRPLSTGHQTFFVSHFPTSYVKQGVSLNP